MGKIKVFPTPSYQVKQPADPVMPRLPMTGILVGPSKSGKTVALISMVLEQYRGLFERIYVFSPSINVDDGWRPVKQYIEDTTRVDTAREQVYFEDWDESALRRIIDQQRKITQTSKQLKMRRLYQILVIIDDFADSPHLHKRTGDSALDTLFARGRQSIGERLPAGGAHGAAAQGRPGGHVRGGGPRAVFLPLHPTLCQSECSNINCCTASSKVYEPLRPWAQQVSTDSEQVPRRIRKRSMTSIYVDSRKRVAGTDSNFDFDIEESVHLQGPLNWAQLTPGAYTGVRLAAWISSNFAAATSPMTATD